MNVDDWLRTLTAELHQRRVAADAARHVVAEVATHLREGGGDPLVVFGPPQQYAGAVVESIGTAPGPRPGPVRLHAEGITKRYRRRPVLRDATLTVRAGQIAAVIGANGCGKSTFLRICAGLVSPDAGEVTVSGRLGYCPQSGGTADFLLADEHFVLVGAGQGVARGPARRAGRAAARQLGWEAGGDVQARHLSGGTRQKLNLTMSTLSRPDVLLLDEPYQGFDQGTYVNFWDQLCRLRDAGTAIVVVTHLLNQLDRVDTVLDLTPAQTTGWHAPGVRGGHS
ncbi:ABC transporter [Micromonospora arborensis]|uniref:ABC transporter n=1 Tax=Micromonospora arborensis TaxID=2116518 RepID=A0A318NMV9_9ACTN|nr:ATP-binding cassette domain-containing protein [Micromonospora arborensis]PYC73322.1 ABC transporter [Micromonospora arborensis]